MLVSDEFLFIVHSQSRRPTGFYRFNFFFAGSLAFGVFHSFYIENFTLDKFMTVFKTQWSTICVKLM